MSNRLLSVCLLLFTATGTTFAQPAEAASQFQRLERRLHSLMTKWHLPGASVAILRDGRLVYSHGLGMADAVQRIPASPESLYRIGSITKSITATAILKLVQQGRLRLDDHVFDRLPAYRAGITDPRALRITIRQLLQHSGGWDSATSGDPIFPNWQELQALGASIPPNRDEVIRYWLTLPLDFEPGTRFAYSNFGYVLLGRVIEKLTGASYEDWTAEHVLAPAGLSWRKLGGSLLPDRARNEARYKDYPGAPWVFSIFSKTPKYVPQPYGSWSLDLDDAAGGWLANAPDLARFIYRLAEGRLLKPETVSLISERPSFVPPDAPSWYGLGLEIIPLPNGFLWEHAGGAPGCLSEIMHAPGLFTYAVLFNSRPINHDAVIVELQQIMIDAMTN